MTDQAHDPTIVRLSWVHPQHGQFISSCFDCMVCIWEHSLPDLKEHGLNSMGLNMCSSK